MRNVTSFPTHSNYNQEIVDADHLNMIQSTLNETELKVGHIYNQEFLSRLLFVFQNASYAHVLSHHEAEHQFLGDLLKCQNVSVKETIELLEEAKEGHFETQLITSSSKTATIDCVSLLLDAYIPIGASVQCYLKVNNERFPVEINGKNPTELPKTTSFNGIIKLYANALGETPVIYGFGYLFSDSEVKDHFTIGYK